MAKKARREEGSGVEMRCVLVVLGLYAWRGSEEVEERSRQSAWQHPTTSEARVVRWSCFECTGLHKLALRALCRGQSTTAVHFQRSGWLRPRCGNMSVRSRDVPKSCVRTVYPGQMLLRTILIQCAQFSPSVATSQIRGRVGRPSSASSIPISEVNPSWSTLLPRPPPHFCTS